jgi:heterodisulfide reductase subunit A
MNQSVALPADHIVLSTGIEPNENRDLARIFDVDLNPDGFFLEANPKSAPLDSVDRGKFFTCWSARQRQYSTIFTKLTCDCFSRVAAFGYRLLRLRQLRRDTLSSSMSSNTIPVE